MRRAQTLAAKQQGLLTYGQAIELGFSKSAIHRLVAGGKWERVLPTVFRLWQVDDLWRQSMTAASLWAGPGGTISHRAAAAWWGFDACERGVVELSLPSPRRSPSSELVIHKLDVPSSDRGLAQNLWVTTPTRTLLDLASVVDDVILETALHSALRDKRTSLARLDALAERNERRNGVRRLKRFVRELSSEGFTESALETKFLQLLRRSRLPMPRRQYEVWSETGLVARVDLAYPDRKIAIEIDGFRFHSSRAQLHRDHRRLNQLQQEGWIVLFVSADDLADTVHLVERIRALLGQERLVV